MSYYYPCYICRPVCCRPCWCRPICCRPLYGGYPYGYNRFAAGVGLGLLFGFI